MSIRYFYRPNVADFDHIIEPVDIIKFLHDNYYKVKQIFSIDEDVNETITGEKHKIAKKIIDVFTINKPDPIEDSIEDNLEDSEDNLEETEDSEDTEDSITQTKKILDSVNTAAEGFDVQKFYNMKDDDSIGKFKSLFSFN